MSVKYRIRFKSQKYAIPYQLDIYDATYSGAIIELAAANPPVVLRKDSDGIFSGTSLDIGIEVPASMPWGITDLYSQSARDHKVELYKSNTLIWSGYLVPEEYSDPLIAPPFDIFLRAVDGIGTLKDFDFAMTANTHQSHLAIIQHCLANLSLSLPLAVLMNIREDAHDAAWNALSQTYINTSAFYDEDGDPLTCDEVISLILQSYDPDITLTQHAGYWMITRDIDAAANAYTTYTVDGAQLASSVAITSTIDLDSLSAYNAAKCFPLGYLTRTMHPQAKKKTLEIDYHLNANILPCKNTAADFSYDATAGWVSKYFLYMESGGITFPACRRIITKDGKYACHAVSTWAGIYNISSFGINYVVPQSGVSFCLLLNVASMHASRTENTNVVVKIQIAVSDTVSYYLSSTGWSTAAASVTLSVPTQIVNTSEASLTELSIIAPPIPAAGHLMLSITPQIPYGNNLTTVPFGFILGETSLRYIREDGENPFESSLTADILINSNALKSETLQCYGDAPAAESVAADIWFSAFLKPDKSPTAKWRMSGDTTSVGLLNIAARSIASNNRIARQVYSGTLMGQSITPNSIIRHAGNSNRLFRIISASHNLFVDELEIEMRELLPYAEATTSVTTSPVYADAKSTATTTDGSNNYTVFGGNVGIGKRIYQLPLSTDLKNRYIILDADGIESAERFPFIEGVSKEYFDKLFEIRGTEGNEYICAKFPFASVGAIVARSTNVNIPSMWDGLPTASTTVKGGIKIGSGLTISADGIVSVDASAIGGNQTLTLSGTTLSISNGNSVSLASISGSSALDQITGFGSGWLSLLGVTKPTTVDGWGITDAEKTIAAGTPAQYWRGDKTWQTLNTDAVPEGTRLYYTDGLVASYLSGAVSSVLTANLTASRVLVSDEAGKVSAHATISPTQLGYLSGLTANVQSTIDKLNEMFEFATSTNGVQYIKAKYSLASLGGITARAAVEEITGPISRITKLTVGTTVSEVAGITVANQSGQGQIEVYSAQTDTYDPSILFHRANVAWGNISYNSSNQFVLKHSPISNTSHPMAGLKVGEIQCIGNIKASGTVTWSSDKRLKIDIIAISDALNKNAKLSGYTYKKNNAPEAGLMAQEVLEVLPEAVIADNEGYYSMNYGAVVALHTQAINELGYWMGDMNFWKKETNTEVEALKKRVSDLESQLKIKAV